MTVLERKSRFYLVKKVTSKHAQSVAQATMDMLQPINDNSLEFADHDFMAHKLDTDVYFADPYAS